VGYEEKQFWASSRSILKYFNMHSFTQNPPPALDPLMRDQLGGSTTPRQLAAEVRFAALLAHALSKFLRLKYSAASVSQFHTAWTSFSRNHLCAAKHWPAKTTRSTMFGQLRAIAGRVPRVKLITGTPRCWCLQPDLGMAQNDSLKSLRTDGVRKLGCK
jgi:hypothetical protein